MLMAALRGRFCLAFRNLFRCRDSLLSITLAQNYAAHRKVEDKLNTSQLFHLFGNKYMFHYPTPHSLLSSAAALSGTAFAASGSVVVGVSTFVAGVSTGAAGSDMGSLSDVST